MRMDYSIHTHTQVDRQVNSHVALFQAVMLVVVLFSLLVVIHNLLPLELYIQILTIPEHLVQPPLTNAEIQIKPSQGK
jgi:TctA family transporter